MAEEDLSRRRAELQARIHDARARAETRSSMDWADIGHLLEAISERFEESHAHAPAARAQAYDQVEKDVADLHRRLGGTPTDR